MLFMEQREQTPNRDGAEELSLSIDHGDICIVSLNCPQGHGLAIFFGVNLDRGLAAQALEPGVRLGGDERFYRHLSDKSRPLIDQIQVAGLFRAM
jgi:hypothetical protein